MPTYQYLQYMENGQTLYILDFACTCVHSVPSEQLSPPDPHCLGLCDFPNMQIQLGKERHLEEPTETVLFLHQGHEGCFFLLLNQVSKQKIYNKFQKTIT